MLACASILRWLTAKSLQVQVALVFMPPVSLLLVISNCSTRSALPILSDTDASQSHLQELMESLVKDLCDVQTLWVILGVKKCVKKGVIFCKRFATRNVQLRVEPLTVK